MSHCIDGSKQPIKGFRVGEEHGKKRREGLRDSYKKEEEEVIEEEKSEGGKIEEEVEEEEVVREY